MTPREAVEFFVNKIEQQAKSEGRLLTDVEKMMLRFSEIEPGGVSDPRLSDEFDRDYDMDTYEGDMGDLLARSHQRESTDASLSSRWEEAKTSLGRHDYYIWTMIWRAFPETKPAAPLAKPSSFKDQMIYLAVGLAVVAVLLYFIMHR